MHRRTAGVDACSSQASTLNSLPPISCPYVTVLPPPETTPLLTVSLATGTPRLVEARPSSACLAVAAAARTCGPRCSIDELPPVLPVFGVRFVSGVERTVSWLDVHVQLFGGDHAAAPVIVP